MMNRRGFLKLGGTAMMLLFLPLDRLNGVLQSPLEVQIDDRFYRGTLDGKIFVSTDQGRTWNLHTNFGSDYAVLNLFSGHGGQLIVKIGYQGHSFFLAASEQGRVWRTVV